MTVLMILVLNKGIDRALAGYADFKGVNESRGTYRLLNTIS